MKYFKANFKATGKVSGYGIDKDLATYQDKWDLRKVECTEITQAEYLRLQELQTNPDYSRFFQVDF